MVELRRNQRDGSGRDEKKTAAGGFDGLNDRGGELRFRALCSMPLPLRNSPWLSYVETSVAGAVRKKKTAAGGFDGLNHRGESFVFAPLLHATCPLRDSRWLSYVGTSVAGAVGMKKKRRLPEVSTGSTTGGEIFVFAPSAPCPCPLRNSRWLSYVETSVAGAVGMKKKTAAGGFDGLNHGGGDLRLRALLHALCPLRNSRWLSYVETSVAGAVGMKKKTAAGGFDGLNHRGRSSSSRPAPCPPPPAQ